MLDDELVKLVRDARPVANEGNKPNDYAALSIDHFMSGKQTASSIYLRADDGRFVKLAHAGSNIDLERLRHFKARGVRELWISRADCPATAPSWTNFRWRQGPKTNPASATASTLACEWASKTFACLA